MAAFPQSVLDQIDAAKILGVRSGASHRFTGVWVVVVERRVFVRSWNDKPTGWYRAFSAEPSRAIQVDGREIPVKAVKTRSKRLHEAITQVFAQKCDTKASHKWVKGFAEPGRMATTIEFLPR